MGDFVQCLGAVRALVEARPDWRFVMVTQASNVPLLGDLCSALDTVTFDRTGGLRAWWRLRRALRTTRFDHALDLQGNWKSAAVTALCGAGRSIGAARPWRQERGSELLLRETCRLDGPAHPAAVAWTLVRRLVPELGFELPRLHAVPSEIDAELAALDRIGIDGRRAFALVVATDPSDPRALPRPRWSEFLATSGLPGLVLVGPAEAALELPTGWPVLRHGRGEVRRLVALGVLAARAGAVVLGPDQGATHVLAAAGANCRVVFGAQDPAATSPQGCLVVRHPAPPACSPCRADRCRHPDGPVCMDFGFSAVPAVGSIEALDPATRRQLGASSGDRVAVDGISSHGRRR